MHFEQSCSGLTQVALNGLKEAGQPAMLLCVKCLTNNERDNFIKSKAKSKAESFVPTTNEINDVLKQIEVTTQKTELKRLGKFSNTRKKSRTLLLTLMTEHDARLVLEKAHEKRTVLIEKGVFISPAYSKEDTIKKFCVLKNEENYLRKMFPAIN